ncbi:MAG: hypothetical protein MJK18_14800, partial [Bdellovibrionales bacterium]|nr:hypothetical protein [Bdellovibrionales bacterium]
MFNFFLNQSLVILALALSSCGFNNKFESLNTTSKETIDGRADVRAVPPEQYDEGLGSTETNLSKEDGRSVIPVATSVSAIENGELDLKSTASSPYLIILESDPSVYKCDKYLGLKSREFPKPDGKSLVRQVHVFEIFFSDGYKTEVHVDPDYENVKDVEESVEKIAQEFGRIPTFLRKEIRNISLFKTSDNMAFADRGIFAISSNYMNQRIKSKKLAQTFFHESIHSVLEEIMGLDQDSAWKSAQTLDDIFISHYAMNRPQREDMAETA